MTAPTMLEVRATWRELLAAIKRAPLTHAQRFVDELRLELDRTFPRKDQ
jgi:hypothetical protein